jgi:hypothetical protein
MKRFSKNFRTVIGMEFTERGSYYGVMSILSAYLVMSKWEGGLAFSKESVGIIKCVHIRNLSPTNMKWLQMIKKHYIWGTPLFMV